MKPRILISGARDGCPNYIRAVEAAGGEAVGAWCPPPETAGYDGLILAGGGDLTAPWVTGENPAPADLDPDRDRAEMAVLAAFRKAGLPVLGICRGMQLINVACGGTLIQDLTPAGRETHTRKDGVDRIHTVTGLAGTRLAALYGLCCRVNSAHHQAVDRLGDGLRAVQWAEDGVVEAVEGPGILAVQWHPERLGGPGLARGQDLMEAFAAWCAGREKQA